MPHAGQKGHHHNNLQTRHAGGNVEKREPSCSLGGNLNDTVTTVYVYQSQLPNSSLQPLSLLVSIYLFYMSVSLCFVNKILYTNFFRFHIYVLIDNICFSSDLLAKQNRCQRGGRVGRLGSTYIHYCV